MGYRSKVIIGVKTGDFSKEFDKILRKHEIDVNKTDGDYLHVHEDPNDKTFYTFNYIQWYDSDDWCKEIMNWLEKQDSKGCNKDPFGKDTVFCVGLGEDGQTHSEIGMYWEYVEQISEINLID